MRRVVLVACALGGFVGACSNATGEVSGGIGRYDAMPPVQPDKPGCKCMGPATWSALYTDYFGPGTKGSCSGAVGDEMNCHLSSSASGAIASLGYVCGATRDSCWQSFAAVLVPPKASIPDKAHYFDSVLRQDPLPACPPACLSPMPLRPASSTFCTCELDRVRMWADNGAKND